MADAHDQLVAEPDRPPVLVRHPVEAAPVAEVRVGVGQAVALALLEADAVRGEDRAAAALLRRVAAAGAGAPAVRRAALGRRLVDRVARILRELERPAAAAEVVAVRRRE